MYIFKWKAQNVNMIPYWSPFWSCLTERRIYASSEYYQFTISVIN